MKKIGIIFKWLVIVLFFILIVSFTHTKYDEQSVFLDDIIIELDEQEFINKNLILDIINRSKINFENQKLKQFSGDYLERILESEPSIKNVEVFVNQEGAINIFIKQKEAIARVITASENYYLSNNAQIIPISKLYTPRVLTINGDVTQDKHQEILNFINIINKDSFWDAQITQVYFKQDNVILIPRVGDHKIHFGLLTNITEKLDNLYQFYKHGIGVKGWDVYSDISLKYTNQIVCTKK